MSPEKIKLVIYGVILITIAQTAVWFQHNWQFVNKKFGPEWWGWYLMAIPITWLFLKSTQLGVTGFGGSVWANRFLGFVVGMLVYAVLTQWFFDQEMTRKVWIQMGLCLSILFVQFYMK